MKPQLTLPMLLQEAARFADLESRLEMMHTIFVDKTRTADFQMTRGMTQILENEGNFDDLIAFIYDEPALYGVTDGKAIGTYLEHQFTTHLLTSYTLLPGF